MTEYYKAEQLKEIEVQKRKTIIIYLSVLAVYIVASLSLCVWYTTLPYKSPLIDAVRWPQCLLTASFVFFTFIFMGIRHKREKRYYKMLLRLQTGLRETSTGSFFEYDDRIMQKDGVDVKSLIFLEWNARKQDFFERKVLVLAEMEYPKFNENDNVRYVTHGNVLVEYEILSDTEEL